MANGERAVPERTGIRKGIYILPNLFTTASLFSGFYGIISTIKGHALNGQLSAMRQAGIAEHIVESFQGGSAAVTEFYMVSAWAILVSAAFDAMDGTVARITNTMSEFGAEYDSLSDAIAFGVAPALLMYSWALEPFGKYGWMACFVYVACAALRLARFNVQAGDVEKKSFQGLPSPGAAAVISTTVLFYLYLNGFTGDPSKKVTWLLKQNVAEWPNWIYLAITFAAGTMMVTNIRYRSSKNLDPLKRLPFVSLLLILAIILLIVAQPHLTLFAIIMTYFFSGPVEMFLFYRHRKRGEHGPSDTLYEADHEPADQDIDGERNRE